MLHLHSKLTCERKGTEGRLPHSIHAFIFFSGESQIFPLPGETDVKLYSAWGRNSAYVKKTRFILIFSRLVIPKSSGSKDSLNNFII